MKVYVVFGGCGDYDDWRTWPVGYYTDLALAERHVQAAEGMASKFVGDTDGDYAEEVARYRDYMGALDREGYHDAYAPRTRYWFKAVPQGLLGGFDAMADYAMNA